MKKIITIVLVLFWFLWFNNVNAEELSITNINSENVNMLNIFVDKDIESQTINLSSDLKLFKDLSIKTVIRDIENDNLVKIVLEQEIENNTNYSLLPIFWVDWSIDFKVWEDTNWVEIIWNELDWVEKLTIVDSKHLDVIFKNTPESDNVEIKLLKEYNIESIKLNSENKKNIQVFLKNHVEDKQKFLIMIFSITTREHIEYTIKNYIYDFETKIMNDKWAYIPLKDNLREEKELENTALNSATTPETWPETWLLIFITFILSSFIYIKKFKN